MADSNIVVSDLRIIAGFLSRGLTWNINDPNRDRLAYLALDAVEVWASTIVAPVPNNRGLNAQRVGEGLTSFVHVGLGPDVPSLLYWIRARNRSGQFGEWYPADPNFGIAASGAEAQTMYDPIVWGANLHLAKVWDELHFIANPSGPAAQDAADGMVWFDGTNLKVRINGAIKTITVS